MKIALTAKSWRRAITLAFLHDNPGREFTVREIGRALGVDHTELSATLDALMERGLATGRTFKPPSERRRVSAMILWGAAWPAG